jgi:hypothetical protein
MVVPIRVGIKPGSVSHGTNTSDDAFVLQKPQRPIDGINRDRRNPSPHTDENRLGVGVYLATGQLPKNLGSLMSCLYALPTAGVQERCNAFLDLFSRRHPKTSSRNHSDVGTIHHLAAACKRYFSKKTSVLEQ